MMKKKCVLILYFLWVRDQWDEAIAQVTCTGLVMPVTFTNFLEQISCNLDAHDGPRLAYLLRVTGPHVKDLLREFKNPTVSINRSRDPPLGRGKRPDGP